MSEMYRGGRVSSQTKARTKFVVKSTTWKCLAPGCGAVVPPGVAHAHMEKTLRRDIKLAKKDKRSPRTHGQFGMLGLIPDPPVW